MGREEGGRIKTPRYTRTILLAALFLIFALRQGNGYLVVLLLLPFCMFLIYNCAQMIRRQSECESRGVVLVIWVVGFCLAGGVHAYWGAASRNDAELVLKRVMAHKERSGVFPASLREVGLDEARLKEKSRIRYRVKDGKPVLTHPVTFMPLSVYQYDFETRAWRQNVY